MSAPPPKLVAISFCKPPVIVLPIQHCESLYIYGVLSQLSRLTEAQYKDLATVPDKVTISQDLDLDSTRQKLRQICDSSRTRYLFTGSLTPAEGAAPGEMVVAYRLYDAQLNGYIAEGADSFFLNPADDEALSLSVAELNRLINQTVGGIADALFPMDLPLAEAEDLPPFSHSLPAMHRVLKAHQSESVSEKIALYQAAIEADPALETAYYHLARIYRAEHQLEQCVIYFRETLKVSQASRRNQAHYATEAGVACALLGRQELALQWWERALAYDPTFISPLFNLANVYEDLENYPQAEIYFRKAQQVAPDDFRTFLNLARIYSKMGQWDKALTQYTHQLSTEEADAWCHSDLAMCYLNLGNVSQARQHLEQTLSLDPEGEAGQYAQLILMGMD